MRTEFIIEFEKMISDFINTHYKPETKTERHECLKELRDHLNGWIEYTKPPVYKRKNINWNIKLPKEGE